MVDLSRRTVLSGALGAGVLGVASADPSAARPVRSQTPGLVTARPSLPSGWQSGDVTDGSAIIWSRTDRPSRLVVRIGRGQNARMIRGPWATPRTDFTAQVDVRGLAPGREYDYRVHFEDLSGEAGEVGIGSLRTASENTAATSFVWTGDTAGQGWGINPDLGGMVGYRPMHELRPDFLIHSGDNIYADGPITEKVTEPDGQVWRNIVTTRVAKVAETLDEFRGRYRYNLLDDNIRAMYADVPVISQWDDHETTNNWYPGEILTDDRYTEQRVDVLAARARQAFFEYMPISYRYRDRARGPQPRMYRAVKRGPLLDVFSLDMRTYRGRNTAGLEGRRTAFLGEAQVEWLLRELSASKATWKAIAADMPIGIIVPDGDIAIEAIANRDPGAPLGRELEIAYLLSQIKKRGIRNVVWFTADVHYCAAHYYDPDKAAFSDFDGFHEFVAGPISAGGFGPNDMDATFGPQVLFQGLPARVNQSPRDQKAMFFGYVQIDGAGEMTVSLRNGLGEVLHTTTLEPSGL